MINEKDLEKINIANSIENEIIKLLNNDIKSYFKNKNTAYDFLKNSYNNFTNCDEILLYSASLGDINIVKMALEKIEFINFNKLFQGAAYSNNQQLMNWLIKKSEEIRLNDIKKCQILELSSDYINKIKKKKYIDVNYGLYGAVSSNNIALFKRFIKMGAKNILESIRESWDSISYKTFYYLLNNYNLEFDEVDIININKHKRYELFKLIANKKYINMGKLYIDDKDTLKWIESFNLKK